MSNLFQSLGGGISNLEQEFLGPDYSYVAGIKNPTQLGITGQGSMSALTNDVAGIVNYVNLLVEGDGPASKTGKPLGNKFFLTTGGQCTDIKTGNLVTRSAYINNQPTGNIPLISAVAGMNFTEFEGLIPGMLTDIGKINPVSLYTAFTEGTDPSCAQVTLQTIDVNNNVGTGTAYVPVAELQDLVSTGDVPASALQAAGVPVTATPPSEGFTGAMWAMGTSTGAGMRIRSSPAKLSDTWILPPKDACIGKVQSQRSRKWKVVTPTNVFLGGTSMLFLYVLYRMMTK
jgi:hypothetical protein